MVVDATVAFIGGINFSADHLGDFGPEAKQDYAVQVIGPAVADLPSLRPWHKAVARCARGAGGDGASSGLQRGRTSTATAWCA